MLEIKDSAIKLFGKTIPVPVNKEILSFLGDRGGDSTHEENLDHDSDCLSTNSQEKKSKQGEQSQEKDQLGGRTSETKEKDGALPMILVELTDPAMSLGNNENPKTLSADKETAKTKSFRTEEEQSDTSSSQEKTILKKPDKILPCPRCNSMDTKFCYYNNYNVNQPRHFCKNCQRYWTAGGTMRNVSVGAGRRKNKNSSSHYQHITVSKTLQTARTDPPNGIHHPTLKPNGTILTFGSDVPICESMDSTLNFTEKTMRNCTRNGFHKPHEFIIPVPSGRRENGDENLKGSSLTTFTSTEEDRRVGLQEPMMQNCHGFPPHIQYIPGAPWPYPSNSAQWTSVVLPPSFSPSNFPISFYPATTYWGCPVPGTWSIHWLPPPSSSLNPGGPGSSPNSPTLGKHLRGGNLLKPSISEKQDPLKQSNSETCVWVPKILRMDDSGEAARSSMWTTLGIKTDKSDYIIGAGVLKAFQSKGDEKNHLTETSQLLQANPAALSRSLNFHESS